MVRPRVSQFADDLKISRPKANKLMKKARARKDGGSEILDSYSPELRKRMQRFEDAERIFTEDTRIGTMSEDKKKKMKLPKSKKKMLDKMQSDVTKNPGTLYDAMEQADLEFDGVEERSRGGGIAIQGTKFVGVR
tara:strand:- start:644 stop:1048 length:405 start_codon:yes stop_codon:yes gene_type:complete